VIALVGASGEGSLDDLAGLALGGPVGLVVDGGLLSVLDGENLGGGDDVVAAVLAKTPALSEAE
jgi:hypothetical protein